MNHITNWRKSSYSGGENSNCVEIMHTLTALRDSKSPASTVLRADVRRLVTALKHEQLDR